MRYIVLMFVLSSCAGANRAYLDQDWERFQQECVEYCAPGVAHPTQETKPWLCDCGPWFPLIEGPEERQ